MLPWLASSLVDGWGSSRTSSVPPESAAMVSPASVLVVVSDRPASDSFAKRMGDARLLVAIPPSRAGVDPSPFLTLTVGTPASVGWADPLALGLSRRGPPPPGIG